MSFYSRYLAGEEEKVWLELASIEKPELSDSTYDDARQVAHETMKRVNHNIQLLIPRLEEIGYILEFKADVPPGKISAFSAPARLDLEFIEYTEASGVALPLSLKAWYKEVGTVCLIGECPESWWEYKYPDPLTVWPAYYTLNEIRGAEPVTGDDGKTRYEVSISPDFYQKDATSGGSPYCVSLPDASIDFNVLYTSQDTTFVSWIRRYLMFGGFIGLEKYSDNLPPELKYLRENFLKI